MKNKVLIAGMAFFSVFALASCNGSTEDYSNLREVVLSDIQADYKTTLGYFYDSSDVDGSSTLLNEVSGTDYFKIYVAKDVKSSLFVYNYDLKADFEAHGEKTLNLTFASLSTTNLYESEKTKITSELFSADKGIKNVLTDFDYADSIYETAEFTRTYDVKDAYKTYSEDTSKNVYLSVVYLPTFVVHVVNGQDKLRDYVLVPICHKYTEEASLGSIRSVDLASYVTDGKVRIKPVPQPSEEN